MPAGAFSCPGLRLLLLIRLLLDPPVERCCRHPQRAPDAEYAGEFAALCHEIDLGTRHRELLCNLRYSEQCLGHPSVSFVCGGAPLNPVD